MVNPLNDIFADKRPNRMVTQRRICPRNRLDKAALLTAGEYAVK